MKKFGIVLMFLSMLSGTFSAFPRSVSPTRNLQFINGQWFDGKKFRSRTFYSVRGILISKRPARIDSVIDLKKGYVVPPFGEAHNHNVEGGDPEKTIRMYLEDGIFYVKNPNILPRSRSAAAEMVNIPASIDVVFANGGLTSTGGHPAGLVRGNISRNIFSETDGDGAFFHSIDSRADLEQKWDAILKGKPDLIKTYLLFSEEFEQRKNNDEFFGQRGLDPALLPAIVSKAHAAGLRVSTHVETAVDLHHALIAGVDEISHMPGFRGDHRNEFPDTKIFEILESDARVAARQGTTVVTTLGGFRELDEKDPVRIAAETLFKRNLNLLRKHGVRIAIGSDSYGETSAPEANYLASLKVFDNLELLKMWCETTPRTIFPGRKIGRLENGYEASFLVLAGDPLKDFTNTRKIGLRIKQGEVLNFP